MSTSFTYPDRLPLPEDAATQTTSLSAATRALAALLRAAAKSVVAGLQAWWASRELQAAPDGMLKDIGISRCGVDWAVRHGRDADFNRGPGSPSAQAPSRKL